LIVHDAANSSASRLVFRGTQGVADATGTRFSGGDEFDVGVPRDDLEDDLEIGLSNAAVEYVELTADQFNVELLGPLQLLAQERARRLDTEIRPAAFEALPDQPYRLASGDRARIRRGACRSRHRGSAPASTAPRT
jgi:hypothetical protein